MSSEHLDPEQVLEDIMSGNLSEDDPRARRALDNTPGLRDRLQRLKDLASNLDAAGDAAQTSLQQELDRRGDWMPKIESVLDEDEDQDRPIPWPMLLAAAAILGVLGWLGSGLLGDPPEHLGDEDIYMGGQGEGDLWPEGDYQAGAAFGWGFEVPPNGHFEVVFYDASDPIDPVLVARVGDATKWTPEATDLEKLQGEMYWELVAVEADGSTSRSLGKRAIRVVR